MSRIELLAPAKNCEAGKAAIDCGADAVYIGAARFGARVNAGNSVSDIETLARYAHIYWARVYVTLNTLLYDDEFPDALQLISQLYEAGIDGLIIQDVGLLECDLPPLPLIASTQMHSNTPEKAVFLEQLGFQRLILARELNLEQISAIRAQTSVIELECFVHGALCVCYSGHCYLSYAIGGRSGNRGECAQPCRKRYTLKDCSGKILSRNRYLLSLKDMNRSEHLRELIEAGVTSFKIEGRLKDVSYIKNIVNCYRQSLDAVLAETGDQKSSSGTSWSDIAPNPYKTFHRGYTSYFLTETAESVASINTPKSIGEQIGTIVVLSKKSCSLETNIPLHNGDGICFFDANGALQGSAVNAVEGETVFPENTAGMRQGTMIYRNYDREFVRRLNSSRIERKIDVALTCIERPDGILLAAADEDGNQAEARLMCEKESAKNPETALATIKKQLTKFGGTEFLCTQFDIRFSAAYFFPISHLNALRRNLLEQLTAARTVHRPRRRYGGSVRNAVPYPETRLSYLANVLNRHAKAFYQRHGVTQIEAAAESGLDMRGRKVMTTKYCLKRELGLCAKDHSSSSEVEEPLSLIDEHGQEYFLHFNCSNCEMEIFFGRLSS